MSSASELELLRRLLDALYERDEAEASQIIECERILESVLEEIVLAKPEYTRDEILTATRESYREYRRERRRRAKRIGSAD